MRDFANFMRMALLVIISGGIVTHAILYPDFPITVELFRRIFHKAWFSLFLTPIEDLEGESLMPSRTIESSLQWSPLYLHAGVTFLFKFRADPIEVADGANSRTTLTWILLGTVVEFIDYRRGKR